MKKLLLFGAIALSSATFSQVPNYVPTNGLVGWWPFNGNANDESGNGNNGTVNGPVLTTDRFGNVNSAYDFDGLNDLIQTSCTPALGSSARSFSFWFKSTLLINSNIFFYGSPNPMYGSFRLGISEPFGNCEGISFNVSDGQFTKSQVCNDNVWHQVVFVLEDGFSLLDVSLFFDGQMMSTNNCSNYGGNTPINTLQEYPLVFGRDIYYNSFYNGMLDDIGIWNRALSQCEVQDLYNAQLNSSTGIEAGPDQTVCDGNSITLSGSGGTNYIWNNTIVNGVPFVPTTTIDYTLLGEDANGCIGTDTMHVEVISNSTSTQTETALDSYTWPINNQTYTQSGTYSAVIPNAAGCDSTITLNLTLDFTGIGENKANFFAVYPNPATSFLTIEGEGIQNKEYALVDIQGRVVLNGTLKTNKETIDLKTLARGQYLLRVEGQEMKVAKE